MKGDGKDIISEFREQNLEIPTPWTPDMPESQPNPPLTCPANHQTAFQFKLCWKFLPISCDTYTTTLKATILLILNLTDPTNVFHSACFISEG